MSEHKYTDEEVIKALECCNDNGGCDNCPFDGAVYEDEPPCVDKLNEAALDLINRQKAEIERLTAEKDTLIKTYKECMVEAIKEFAEWLEALEEVVTSLKDGEPITAVETYYIHEFVKKFTEEKT